MRDVTYIEGKDHVYNVHLPDGSPFQVKFKADVSVPGLPGSAGGHFPAGENKWVKGVPDEVADVWQANQQPAQSGFLIAPKPKGKKGK